MACGNWKAGVGDHEAVFHLTFQENPFGGEFTVACGLATAIDFLRTLHFTRTEIDYLALQNGNDGRPLFESNFLDHQRGLRLTCDIDGFSGRGAGKNESISSSLSAPPKQSKPELVDHARNALLISLLAAKGSYWLFAIPITPQATRPPASPVGWDFKSSAFS
jgi:hypothetical protein